MRRGLNRGSFEAFTLPYSSARRPDTGFRDCVLAGPQRYALAPPQGNRYAGAVADFNWGEFPK